jgi:hypothetical protein
MTITETVLNAFSALFIQFDPEAASVLLAPDYIQHNPAVPTGAAAIVGFVPVIQQSGMTATTHRVITEGDLVVPGGGWQSGGTLGQPAAPGGAEPVGPDHDRWGDGDCGPGQDGGEQVAGECVCE